MKPKYAIHPGWIMSKNDGDWHYIGAAKLARLYELKPGEFVIWWKFDDNGMEPKRRLNGMSWDDFIHLYPDDDGRYGRPDAG